MKTGKGILLFFVLFLAISGNTNCRLFSSKSQLLTIDALVGKWEIEQFVMSMPDVGLTMTVRPMASEVVLNSGGQFNGFIKFKQPMGHGPSDDELSGKVDINPESGFIEATVNPPDGSRLVTSYKGRLSKGSKDRLELETKISGNREESIVQFVKVTLKRKPTAQ